MTFEFINLYQIGNKEIINFIINLKETVMYIFDSDMVWRMQLMLIKGLKFVLCV